MSPRRIYKSSLTGWGDTARNVIEIETCTKFPVHPIAAGLLHIWRVQETAPTCVHWPEPPSRAGPCRTPAPAAPSRHRLLPPSVMPTPCLLYRTERQSVPVTAPTHSRTSDFEWRNPDTAHPSSLADGRRSQAHPALPPRRDTGQPCRASQQQHRFCAGSPDDALSPSGSGALNHRDRGGGVQAMLMNRKQNIGCASRPCSHLNPSSHSDPTLLHAAQFPKPFCES